MKEPRLKSRDARPSAQAGDHTSEETKLASEKKNGQVHSIVTTHRDATRLPGWEERREDRVVAGTVRHMAAEEAEKA